VIIISGIGFMFSIGVGESVLHDSVISGLFSIINSVSSVKAIEKLEKNSIKTKIEEESFRSIKH
jgi:hypothetical protein